MSTPGPNPPAGWYPDPTNPEQQRYWDGSTWTEHTAPGAAATPQPATFATQPYPPVEQQPPATQLYPPAAQQPTTAQRPTAGGWAGMPTKTKALIIGGAALALIVGIGGVSAALNGGRNETPAPAAVQTTPTPVATPTPTPTPVPAPEPAPAVVDVAAFKTEAHSHLDDMTKDLDDMVVTIDEGGFWRLLSNSVELSFNVAQLQVLDVPSNIAVPYIEGVVGLETSIASMTDPIGNEDTAALRAIIDQMRGQIEGMHALVDTGA